MIRIACGCAWQRGHGTVAAIGAKRACYVQAGGQKGSVCEGVGCRHVGSVFVGWGARLVQGTGWGGLSVSSLHVCAGRMSAEARSRDRTRQWGLCAGWSRRKLSAGTRMGFA